MPHRNDLAHILKLLDDDSPKVQEAVRRELEAMGSLLEEELANLPQAPTKKQRWLIQRLLAKPDAENAQRAQRKNLFEPGQLVKHERYGYRGVVVDFDMNCQADEDWYLSNRTQPDRAQPWYHVLVHNSDQGTYAAQSSLLPDTSGLRVVHSLEPLFFSAFNKGRYIRNNREWPK